jgi:hypothetical protein
LGEAAGEALLHAATTRPRERNDAVLPGSAALRRLTLALGRLPAAADSELAAIIKRQKSAARPTLTTLKLSRH